MVRGLAALAAAGCSVAGTPGEVPGPRQPVVTVVQEAPARGREGGAPATVRRVGAEAGPLHRFEEVRGLWVVRTTLTEPERIRRMVADAQEAGFNTLLVQVRGRGDAYYDSRWEPRAEQLAGGADFDPLALVLEEAHARGMAVHAWVNTYLVWSGPRLPESPRHLVNQRPEWLAVPKRLARRLGAMDPHQEGYAEALRRYAVANGQTVEGIFASPSHPGVQDRIYDVWMDLAERYELDGIHFDYVRFASPDFDYSRDTLERFRVWLETRIPAERLRALDAEHRGDLVAYTDALPLEWSTFRREQVTLLVERIYRGVKARRPDLVVSAAVFSNAQDAFESRFQDWRSWLDRGIVDLVVPMAYTPGNRLFQSQIREAAVSAGRRERVWAGVGAYQNGVRGTLEKIDIARREGVGGVVLFSYDWAVTQGSAGTGVPFLQAVGGRRFSGS